MTHDKDEMQQAVAVVLAAASETLMAKGDDGPPPTTAEAVHRLRGQGITVAVVPITATTGALHVSHGPLVAPPTNGRLH